MSEDRNRKVLFCCRCFATDENGSWGSGMVATQDGAYCLNCGANYSGNGVLSMTAWQADSIRESASFVGTRYYPSDEDKQTGREIKALRALPSSWPGRSAERTTDGTAWWVTQRVDGEKRISVTVPHHDGLDADGAVRLAAGSLPYVPEGGYSTAAPSAQGQAKS